MTKWFSSLYAGDKSYFFQMIKSFTLHILFYDAPCRATMFISLTLPVVPRDVLYLFVRSLARSSSISAVVSSMSLRWSKEREKSKCIRTIFHLHRVRENSKNVSMRAHRIARSLMPCHIAMVNCVAIFFNTKIRKVWWHTVTVHSVYAKTYTCTHR